MLSLRYLILEVLLILIKQKSLFCKFTYVIVTRTVKTRVDIKNPSKNMAVNELNGIKYHENLNNLQ